MTIHSFLQVERQQEILQRIQKLQPQSQAQWGKLNVIQMIEHCTKVTQIYLKEMEASKPFFLIKPLGILFKKMFTKDNRIFTKNSPTDKKLLHFSPIEFEQAKHTLLLKLEAYYKGLEANSLQYQHPFFGLLKREECAILNYKHFDHHLRQFGV